MDLEITAENQFLCALVLSGHEFEGTEQIKSFLLEFLKKMTHDEIKNEAYNTLIGHNDTEEFVTNIIDTKPTPDFLKQFLVPTCDTVFINYYIKYIL